MGETGRARAAYERAWRANPADARLLYERDQLWKRLGVSPARRLAALRTQPALVGERDDLALELAALYNQAGRPAAAQRLLAMRVFQPWEGGEGQALGQHVRTQLALGRAALRAGRPAVAWAHFEAALKPPRNLGESRHPLANPGDIHFWLGEAWAALGDHAAAREHWRAAAAFQGDFQEMKVRSFSEMTYYTARALGRLAAGGRPPPAGKALRAGAPPGRGPGEDRLFRHLAAHHADLRG